MSSNRINIIMLSGGYDSTGVLCNALKNTSDDVIAHHIHLINREGRDKAEKLALRAIIPLAREIRDFKYIYTIFDYRKLGDHIFDLMICGHFGSLTACNYAYDKNNNSRVVVSLGITKGESSIVLRLERTRLIFDALFIDLPKDKRPKLETPLIEYEKAEVIDRFIPLEIKERCWTCRTPIYKIEKCGKCFACINEQKHENK